MKQYTDSRLGRASQARYPQYGACARCETVWALVHGHSVSYIGCTEETRKTWWDSLGKEMPPRYKDTPTSGIFALCEQCWDELTPEERLPYYYDLYWRNHNLYNLEKKSKHQADLEWEEIQTHILIEADR